MRAEIVYLRLEIEIGMFAIHTSEHAITSRLKREVEIVTHFRKVEVGIEDILRHIMGIRTRETDTIETVYRIDAFVKISKWSSSHSPSV